MNAPAIRFVLSALTITILTPRTTFARVCGSYIWLLTRSVGVTLRRYNAVAAPVNEGVVNGYLRYKVQVSPTKPHAVHGLISDMAYIRNRVNAKTVR